MSKRPGLQGQGRGHGGRCTNTGDGGSASGCAGVQAQDLAACCPSPSLYTTRWPSKSVASCFLPNRMSLHGRKRHADGHATLDPPNDTRRVQHKASYTDIKHESRPSPSRYSAREDRKGLRLGAPHTSRVLYAELQDRCMSACMERPMMTSVLHVGRLTLWSNSTCSALTACDSGVSFLLT